MITRKKLLEVVARHCRECDPENHFENPAVECPEENCKLKKCFYTKSIHKILGIIRDCCLDCSGGDKRNLANCTCEKTCSFWLYRFGREPQQKSRKGDVVDNAMDEMIDSIIFG